MRTIPCATTIALTAEERAVLEALERSTKSEVRMRDRARIVLLAADGLATRAIGRIVGCTTGTASKWRVRYARARLGGSCTRRAIGALRRNTALPSKNASSPFWISRRQPVTRIGPRRCWRGRWAIFTSNTFWRFLRAQKIDLSGRKSSCESSDPEFVAKAAEIVYWAHVTGERCRPLFYEKPSIQAL